jgi:hypothetical protein
MQLKSIAAAALVAAVVVPASADVNLVSNGDFSQGGTDWAFTAASQGSDFRYVTNAAGFGAVSTFDDIISQDLHTVAGQVYRVTFNASFGTPGSGSDLFASIGGQTIASFVNPSASGYNNYTYTFTANSSDTLLAFAGRNIPSWNYVTNVSVSAVPEPETYALMGLGMLAMLAFYRKRNNAF